MGSLIEGERVYSDKQTIFGKQLMKERGEIEQQFGKFKDKGLEQPRWYGQNRYLLGVEPASTSKSGILQ